MDLDSRAGLFSLYSSHYLGFGNSHFFRSQIMLISNRSDLGRHLVPIHLNTCLEGMVRSN